ncbi:hypothetical protein PAXRUDRAFT_22253 [Paxillus rubicundulus Ve08.2h10]|uniref:Retrotransposon Copia-like N-terminal domain-containing protein n=1 Tax=Paxillus rubicundulus Ve08.2h10 TaxID=930991 RepID=A0A0D0BKM0_9AGAM|nr:hypothetical protein PAXRUDRAFT_22253 [Paxillus rubicundulus Ve08.2h10]
MPPRAESKLAGGAGAMHTRSRTVTSGMTPLLSSPISPLMTMFSISTTHTVMTSVPPAYYIQHAPVSIQTAKLNTQSFEKIEVLDRSKNNWSNWSFAIKLVLNQHLVSGYLMGAIAAPDPLLKPGTFNNWTLNNIAIVSALCSRVTHEDQCLLEDVTNAKNTWDTLCQHHEKVGPIAQIILIQEVL